MSKIEEFKIRYGVKINENEIGFNYSNVLELIDLYREENIPIMGGDVYVLKNNRYVPTYDNWYFNKNQVIKDYLKESIERSINYIQSYKNKDNLFFVLVPN